MTRQVLYVAAPLAPSEEEIAATPSHTGWSEDEVGRNLENLESGGRPIPEKRRAEIALRANLDRALRWLSWLRRSFPETTFIAPWIATILSGVDDSDPAAREAGLVDDCAVVERCDGIVLCGPRVSSGMRREMEHNAGGYGEVHSREGCFTFGPFKVYDLTPMTGLGFTPEQGQRPCSDIGVSLRPIPWKEWAEEFRIK